MTAADLRAEAEDLEAAGQAAGPPACFDLWKQADRLRDRATSLEAAAWDWRSEVPRLLAAAVDDVLPRGVRA